jgi:hypothetical protein
MLHNAAGRACVHGSVTEFLLLPFSHEQFFAVFAAYNRALWPFAAVLWALSLGAFVLVLRGARNPRSISTLLAAHWAWAAIAYHWAYFAAVNPAAVAFGAVFLAQALLLGIGAWRDAIRYSWRRTPRHVIGALLVVYALLYPALAELFIGAYPSIPTFGVPCPTTLLTIGFLLLTTPLRISLLIIPSAWTVVGGSAAVLFGVLPDWALLAAGLAVLLVTVTRLRGR